MNFVDFEKVFDSVDHQALWKVLRHYGIPSKIVTLIQQFYDGLTCQVIHAGTLTTPFNMTTGVRHGCLLYPLLFTIIIDWVSKTAYNIPRGIQWTFQSRLEDLDFADDICQLSHRLTDAQEQISRLETTANRVGLKINASKTKSMRINSRQEDKIRIGEL